MEHSPTGDDVVEEIARHVEGNDVGIPVDGPLPRGKWTRSVAVVVATQKGLEVCDDGGEAVGFVGGMCEDLSVVLRASLLRGKGTHQEAREAKGKDH
ncbi:unnamed protein product [Agarophyton chilense]